jgi:hypothetical protein
VIRWLRPEYQAPAEYATRDTQYALTQESAEETPPVAASSRALRAWPAGMAEQAAAVRSVLAGCGRPVPGRERSAHRRVAGDPRRARPGAPHRGWMVRG